MSTPKELPEIILKDKKGTMALAKWLQIGSYRGHEITSEELSRIKELFAHILKETHIPTEDTCELSSIYDKPTHLKCRMNNSIYDIELKYQNGIQTLIIAKENKKLIYSVVLPSKEKMLSVHLNAYSQMNSNTGISLKRDIDDCYKCSFRVGKKQMEVFIQYPSSTTQEDSNKTFIKAKELETYFLSKNSPIFNEEIFDAYATINAFLEESFTVFPYINLNTSYDGKRIGYIEVTYGHIDIWYTIKGGTIVHKKAEDDSVSLRKDDVNK